ncbi:Nucleolar complex protein 4 [Homalodisca vitripennis]|nr:Nucleolar complex protein 4 [Homalodisca vitripennis]
MATRKKRRNRRQQGVVKESDSEQYSDGNILIGSILRPKNGIIGSNDSTWQWRHLEIRMTSSNVITCWQRHLPLTLVASFAKRFSRLLLVASPPDMLILLTFIANLLIRHPNLKFLCHNRNGKDVDDDVYNESEKDPVKSGASQSQLWEVKLLQQHPCERVAKLARSISDDLPSVEYQLEPLLDLTWQKMIKRDIKNISRKIPVIAEKFEDKPLSNKMEEARQKEFKILFSEISKLFVF